MLPVAGAAGSVPGGLRPRDFLQLDVAAELPARRDPVREAEGIEVREGREGLRVAPGLVAGDSGVDQRTDRRDAGICEQRVGELQRGGPAMIDQRVGGELGGRIPVRLHEERVEHALGDVVVDHREAVRIRVEVADLGAHRATIAEALGALLDGEDVAAPPFAERARVEARAREPLGRRGEELHRGACHAAHAPAGRGRDACPCPVEASEHADAGRGLPAEAREQVALAVHDLVVERVQAVVVAAAVEEVAGERVAQRDALVPGAGADARGEVHVGDERRLVLAGERDLVGGQRGLDGDQRGVELGVARVVVARDASVRAALGRRGTRAPAPRRPGASASPARRAFTRCAPGASG